MAKDNELQKVVPTKSLKEFMSTMNSIHLKMLHILIQLGQLNVMMQVLHIKESQQCREEVGLMKRKLI